jgi:hypothetical protein
LMLWRLRNTMSTSKQSRNSETWLQGIREGL